MQTGYKVLRKVGDRLLSAVIDKEGFELTYQEGLFTFPVAGTRIMVFKDISLATEWLRSRRSQEGDKHSYVLYKALLFGVCEIPTLVNTDSVHFSDPEQVKEDWKKMNSLFGKKKFIRENRCHLMSPPLGTFGCKRIKLLYQIIGA